MNGFDERVEVFDGVVEEQTQALAALEGRVKGGDLGVAPDDLRQMVALDEQRRAIIKEYISRNLKSGTDYGTIPIAGRETKPSLFKPGAEKVCMLLQLRASFEPDVLTRSMAGDTPGLFAYVCRLYAFRSGELVAEGRGAAELGEKRGWTVNNAIKIAQKRAQIDAVLRVAALSEVFTQDIEDGSQRAATSQQGTVQGDGFISPSQERQILAMLSPAGVDGDALLRSLDVDDLARLTKERAQGVISDLRGKIAARNNKPAAAEIAIPVVETQAGQQYPPINAPAGRTATISEKQLKAIYAIARAVQRLNEGQTDARCMEMFNCRVDELSKAEASEFIDVLKNEQPA